MNNIYVATEEDRQVRNLLFWIIIAAVLVFAGAGRLYEAHWRQELTRDSERYHSGVYTTDAHGSLGSSLFAMPPSSSPRKIRVLVLGNSVYQNFPIIQAMQEMANNDKYPVAFVNAAQTASGICDYIVRIATLTPEEEPDIIMIGYINLAFTPNFGPKELPLFRTDNSCLLYEPEVFRKIYGGETFASASREDKVSAFLSTLFPLLRLDPILRYRANMGLGLQQHRWFRNHFSITLNLAKNWMERTAPKKISTPVKAYPNAMDLMNELVQLTNNMGIPLLMIRHESGPMWAEPDIYPQIQALAQEHPLVHAADFSSYYRADVYPDQVHPKRGSKEVHNIAARHYARLRPLFLHVNKMKIR